MKILTQVAGITKMFFQIVGQFRDLDYLGAAVRRFSAGECNGV